ncbi:hypothetical protein JTE90_022471 [Oedothorax gibbosus]|uniref:Complex I assembly factor TIMMDC1, mitochondrial n=1 Tax=Oedothorax gibbosus TaxID=931172 RepID=A0AAV6TW91_9ARAC|nr:hypothetical protein JTE90_022471 [Oedothorax gibbosus]
MGILNFVYTSHCSEKFTYVPEFNVKEALSKETGRDRIRRMYSTDEFGYSPEMFFVITTAWPTAAFAALYGGIKGMLHEHKDFMRRNVATTYESQHLARRSLTDNMTKAVFRGAAKYGLQYGGFSTLYLLSTFTIANYRNEMSPWEHAASAAAVGGLARINFGFRGVLVAGALGGVLGLIAGSIITATMKLQGISMEDFRCWQQEDHYIRRRKKDKSKT